MSFSGTSWLVTAEVESKLDLLPKDVARKLRPSLEDALSRHSSDSQMQVLEALLQQKGINLSQLGKKSQ